MRKNNNCKWNERVFNYASKRVKRVDPYERMDFFNFTQSFCFDTSNSIFAERWVDDVLP